MHSIPLRPAQAFAALAILGLAPRALPAEVQVLTPFEVNSSKDYGYLRANSISATGFAIPIQDLPYNISVISSDLIDDTASHDLKEIIEMVPGALPRRNSLEWEINLRGFNAAVRQNGLEVQSGMASLGATDRVEIIRGPSSVFYGNVEPGGVINVITPRPTAKPAGEFSLAIGNYDYFRYRLRSSGPLFSNRIGYVAVVHRAKSNGWAEHEMRDEQVYYGGLEVDVLGNERVKAFVYFERQDDLRNRPFELTYSHPAFEAARVTATNVNIRNWVATNVGPNEPWGKFVANELYYPRGFRFNLHGPEGFDTRLGDRAVMIADVRLAERLHLRSSFKYEHARTLNMNPRFTEEAWGGHTLNIHAMSTYAEQKASTAENRLVWEPEFWRQRQTILLGHLLFRYRSANRQFQGTRGTYNAFTDPIPRIRTILSQRAGFDIVTQQPPLNLGPYNEDQAIYLYTHLRFPGDRLKLSGGVRHYRIDSPTFDATETIPQLGLLYQLTPRVNLWANFAKTYIPVNVQDFHRNRVPPREGEGWELGSKFNFGDGRVVGTLAVFENAFLRELRDTNRELVEGVSPLYGRGDMTVKGSELELFYTPRPNLQFVWTQSWYWFAKVVRWPNDPRLEGKQLEETPQQTYNLRLKHTLTTDNFLGSPRWKGLHYGGGVRRVSSYPLEFDALRTAEEDGYTTFDLFAGYERPFGRGRWSLTATVNNVGGELYFDNGGIGAPREIFLQSRFNW